MKAITLIFSFLLMISCQKFNSVANEKLALNQLAKEYVRLGLAIGQYDGDFVDAFYGDSTLKPSPTKQLDFPKDSFLLRVEQLQTELKLLSVSPNDTIQKRANWISSQLTSFRRRILTYSGEFVGFDQESKELFDAVAPAYPESHFQNLITRLDHILPGKGALPVRFQLLANQFLLPQDKIDLVFRTAIAEARKRTLEHYKLPEEESFTLEYVKDKPWSGYNWYQGNYKSIIQINTSQPIFIERAIDLACHEGYPGHHVFNVLLEKNLYRDKGWEEISLYPLFSPQSLIAEGSANYGITVAFPEKEQEDFCKKVLMPIAGIDMTGSQIYFEALTLKSQLNYARNEVARGIASGKMDDKEAVRWLSEYCLLTPKGASDYLRFIRKYRSYVINYNYGQDLVGNYVENKMGNERKTEKRWQVFEKLLTSEFTASDLKTENK